MTEKRYKAAKPFLDAAALSMAVGGTAIFAKTGNWFVGGAALSFYWYWVKGNLLPGHTLAPRRVGVPKSFDMEAYQPGTISRQTLTGRLRRWVQPDQPIRPQRPPRTPQEFVFLVFYNGSLYKLREKDVRLFLLTAWRNRHRGRGLSNNFWVIDWQSRPRWYRDLGPYWYRAFICLLREAQIATKSQLVVCTGWQWYALARDPHTTLGRLKEAEYLKGHVVAEDLEVLNIS